MRGLLAAASGATLGALVSLRTVVAFTDMPWFDVDPSLDPNAFAGLGPAGSLWIDAGIAALSAVLVGVFAGRAAALVAVAALAVLVARLRSESDLGAMGWRGLDWMSAWCACGAAAAVARNPRPMARLAWSSMVAVLLGVCCLWLARGAWQWFHEHGNTLRYFQEQARESFFADRGWDPDGPQALSYQRRLMQREMTGWFGLANIFSGVMAVGAVALAGLPRMQGRSGGSWGMLSAGCAVAVLANGGKGAIIAMGIGFAMVLLLRRFRVRPWTLAGVASVAVIVSASAAWLRAVPLAAAFPGERSLLFRWHYLQTAWHAWMEGPWLGTGPDRFQDASARLRPAEAVEIVRSAHAAFADWVAQLGAGGFVWIVAAMALLVWAARGAAMEPAPLPTPEARDGNAQRAVMVAVLVAVLLSIVAEASTLDPASTLLRWVGGAAWAGAAVVLLPRLWSARASGSHMLFPAALVALCHAQVEMTLWNPGSAAWLLALLGAAVPSHALDPSYQEYGRSPRLAPRAVGALACAVVALLTITGAAGQARMERSLEAVATRLVEGLRATSGRSPESVRREAAQALARWSRILSAEQYLRAADSAGSAGASDLLSACEAADAAVQSGAGLVQASRLETLHASAHAWERRALVTAEAQDQSVAFDRALAVTRFDAGSASAWLRAARRAAALDRPETAALATEAIRCDDAMGLDPLLRLSPPDRALAERLAGVSAGPPASAR
ncbi:MAG: O-antigen ligase family protein [Phycisphaerales bacterium]